MPSGFAGLRAAAAASSAEDEGEVAEEKATASDVLEAKQ
jgi:hypothetical protein